VLVMSQSGIEKLIHGSDGVIVSCRKAEVEMIRRDPRQSSPVVQ